MLHQLRQVLSNLWYGLRLSLALPAPLSRFCVSVDQAVLLPLLLTFLVFAEQFWRASPQPEFIEYGFADHALGVLGVLATGYVVGKWLRRERTMQQLTVLIYSVAPFTYLVWQGLDWYVSAQPAGYATLVAQGGFLLWTAAIVLGIFWRLSEGRWWRWLPTPVVYLILVSGPAYLLGEPQFWRPATFEAEPASAAAPLNAENVFYAQLDRMSSAAGELLAQRPGVTDLYFLGFAGHGLQDVFMKEVKFAQALFDNRFDTAGRSLVLVNNRATVEQDPIASSSNLREALFQIGRRMNPEEDILFLFITSHGYEDHRIDVTLDGVPLNDIDPNDLRDYLDEAGIRWRVLMVSACYSGGFVEALRDSHTLVATASAKDRTSFGCGTAEAFTYFGQAVLAEQLTTTSSFVAAFETARSTIAEREAKEGLELSLPQLDVGAAIGDKLAQWAKQRDARVAFACRKVLDAITTEQVGACAK